MQSEIQGAIMSENNTKCRPTSISHGYLMLSSFNCIPALATEVMSTESNRQKYVTFTATGYSMLKSVHYTVQSSTVLKLL